MRKHLTMVLAVLCLAVLPAGAYAQDMDGDNDIRVDVDNDFDLRPYVGVGLGAFGLEFKNSTGSMKKVAFGGYARLGTDIGDYLGLELRIGATGSGKKTVNAQSWKARTSDFVSYLAKLQFPASPDFRLYTLLGGTTGKFEWIQNGTAQSQNKTGFSYGVGAEAFLQDSLSVGAEWVQYWTNVNMDTTRFGTGAKTKMWGVVGTAAYRF